MWHLDDADATAEAPVVHGAAELPVIGILVEYFDSLQVGCPVETAHGEKLPVYHGEANL